MLQLDPLVQEWAKILGPDNLISAADLHHLAHETVWTQGEGDYRDLPTRTPKHTDLHDAIGSMTTLQLGAFLRRHVGQVVGDYRLCGQKFEGGWRWWLERVGAKVAA